jgi:hypothetical protein
MYVLPRKWPLLFFAICQVSFAQVQNGELRVTVSDPSGLPLPSSIALVSESSRTERDTKTSANGQFAFHHLAMGVYRLTVDHAGFTPYSSLVEIRSAVPKDVHVQLTLATASTEVVVKDSATLLDPHRTGVDYAIGSQQLREEAPATPGRGVLDLINMQPGWLFEANGVLHPRGSEYQTQFVVDGMPMEENQSPGFAPGLETNDVSEMTVLTGNYPAEYGRKLGGVIEVTTARDITAGFHGSAELGGGSFDSETGSLSGSYGWTHSSLTLDGSGSRTDRYLDPPVLGNFTNTGTLGSFGVSYDQDLGTSDRVFLSVHRSQSRFEVPNENVQQAAGQREDRTTPEDSGQIGWSHVLSPEMLLNVRASVEDLSANLWSNPFSTPIIAAQQRGFRRSYLNTNVSIQKKRHDLKFGGDAIYSPVSEALQYRITDPTFFDPGTPPLFEFSDHRLDREQSLFAQDTMHYGNLTLSAGMRWDHYSLAVNDHAFSPRLGVAWYVPKAGLIVRFSYDRVFQTPATENLLLASSPQVDQLNPEVLRIPVTPSRGNYFEAGLTQGIAKKARLDLSFYRRSFVSFADDDVFLNTGISFPIAFRSAQIRGVDVKLDLPRWGKLSGFLTYSNMRGVSQLPVVGGLFLGSDANGVLGANSSFAITQDQRNTARARGRYQISPRVWVSADAQYGSGLPVELSNDVSASDLEAQYGARIVDRLNLDAGRVRPNFSLDLNAGADLWKHEKSSLQIQGEIDNVTNRLNVIDFAGLFLGTAVAPLRSGSARLIYRF